MNSAKILIVEEINNVAKEIRNNLKKLGFEVTGILKSAEGCFREVFKNKPDLILMDSGANNGYDNIEIANNLKKDFEIPIIYLTHYPERYTMHRAGLTEPYEYLVKPVNVKNLYSAIEITLYRERIDKKLRESEGIYRTIFENTGNATVLIEEDKKISLANKEFEKLSGYSRKEIEGIKKWTEFVSEEDLGKVIEYYNVRRINPSAAPKNYEFQFIDRFKEVKDIYMTSDYIPGTKKSVASFMNITEQKRLESEIIRISEQERFQIGNDLHDGLGPHLVGIKFMINLLKQKLEKKSIEEVSDIDEINEHISQAIIQTQQLVKGLSPVDIDADGLIFALDDLANNVEKLYGISCKFNHDKQIFVQDKITAIHLYLIIQEALNNSIKHSRAKNIIMELSEKNKVLNLIVKDDGIGIEKLLDKRKGMGINIMKYRARIINSSLNIGQNDTGGTSVSVALNVNRPV